MTAVMIGVDPHKATHTAVVIGPAEEPLGELRIRASAGQAEKLVAWADRWPERTWAVDGRRRAGCWPSSSSLPASGSWTSSRSWRPGAAAAGW